MHRGGKGWKEEDVTIVREPHSYRHHKGEGNMRKGERGEKRKGEGCTGEGRDAKRKM